MLDYQTSIWLSAALIFASVVVRVVTGSYLTKQRRELSQLRTDLAKLRHQLEATVARRQSAESNISFYERRLADDGSSIEQLSGELEEYEALEANEGDESVSVQDEEQAVDTEEQPVVGGEVTEATAEKGVSDALGGEASPPPEGDDTAKSEEEDRVGEAIAVVPADLGNADKLFLPDALASELLAMGLPIMERAVLLERVREAGDKLERLVADESYMRLGDNAELVVVFVATAVFAYLSLAFGRTAFPDIESLWSSYNGIRSTLEIRKTEMVARLYKGIIAPSAPENDRLPFDVTREAAVARLTELLSEKLGAKADEMLSHLNAELETPRRLWFYLAFDGCRHYCLVVCPVFDRTLVLATMIPHAANLASYSGSISVPILKNHSHTAT